MADGQMVPISLLWRRLLPLYQYPRTQSFSILTAHTDQTTWMYGSEQKFQNDPKFLARRVWANSADPGQTTELKFRCLDSIIS